jgi:hypothetical protein
VCGVLIALTLDQKIENIPILIAHPPWIRALTPDREENSLHIPKEWSSLASSSVDYASIEAGCTVMVVRLTALPYGIGKISQPVQISTGHPTY